MKNNRNELHRRFITRHMRFEMVCITFVTLPDVSSNAFTYLS